MIVIMIACTIVSLLLTIVHKQRFLNECVMGQGVGSSADKCSSMYASALVGSMLGCLIGMTMIVRTYIYSHEVLVHCGFSRGTMRTKHARSILCFQSSGAMAKT